MTATFNSVLFDGKLASMHSTLMYHNIPYSQCTVLFRHQDLDYHIFFDEKVKQLITEELKSIMKINKFKWSFTNSE